MSSTDDARHSPTDLPPSGLFAPYDLGPLTLPNRVVMSPMTRARCDDEAPTTSTATYYAQRATAGLIVTEGTFVSPEARGYVNVPGLWNERQAARWSAVTDAVHEANGRIVCQLWHVGRVSHTSLQPDGRSPVSPTARRAGGEKPATAYAIADDGRPGFVPVSAPRALATHEVKQVVEDFAQAAVLAARSGFDGVEVHAANGYLFEQFLNPHVNDRTDAYGGSIAARSRALVETAEALRSAFQGGVLGIRLSPYAQLFDNPAYAETEDTYLHVAGQLRAVGVDYMHVSDHRAGGHRLSDGFLQQLGEEFGGTIILAGGLDRALAESYLNRGLLDLAAFGRPFIANPDLVGRLRNDWPLAEADPGVFYGGGEAGYTDFPPLSNDWTEPS